jgi:hypothetical protein
VIGHQLQSRSIQLLAARAIPHFYKDQFALLGDPESDTASERARQETLTLFGNED